MIGSFSDKIVVVMGAASGIGAAACDCFEARGARVYKLDIAYPAGPATDGDAGRSLYCNVTASASVTEAIDWVMAQGGRIDALICCAGLCPPEQPSHLVTDEQWRATLALNCDGVFYCNRAVIPHMMRAGQGRIVNVSSLSAQRGDPQQSAYSAAKAGVVALTKALGREYAPKNILINAVIPGIIDTPPFRALPEVQQNQLLDTIPVNRAGLPAEVADLIAFLASTDQGYLAGAAFEIAGGRGS